MKHSFAFVLTMFLLAFPVSATPAAENLWSISTKHLVLKPGERIAGFTLKLKAASIKSLPRIPSMWKILIYNFEFKDAPWSTTVDAQADVGVAYLEPSFFNKDFVCIRKGAFDVPFDAQLKIVASGSTAKARVITIPVSGLAIRPMERERLWQE